MSVLGIHHLNCTTFRLRFARAFDGHRGVLDDRLGGDSWYGLQQVRPIKGLGGEFALIPLVGHSAGHCGVAVRGKELVNEAKGAQIAARSTDTYDTQC